MASVSSRFASSSFFVSPWHGRRLRNRRHEIKQLLLSLLDVSERCMSIVSVLSFLRFLFSHCQCVFFQQFFLFHERLHQYFSRTTAVVRFVDLRVYKVPVFFVGEITVGLLAERVMTGNDCISFNVDLVDLLLEGSYRRLATERAVFLRFSFFTLFR